MHNSLTFGTSSQIKFKTNFKNCILDALKRKGYKEVEG